MSNPPPDRSALWTNNLVDTSGDAAKAAGALDDARRLQAGLPFVAEGDRAVLEKRASDQQFAATQQLGQAQYGAQLYQQQEFVVQTHNEPINSALAQAEAARSAQLLADTAKFMTAAVVTTAVVGASTQPGGLTSAFGQMFGLGESNAPATTMTMGGPSSFFNSRSAPIEAFGKPRSLDMVLGPIMPAVAIDDVAMKSPAVAEAMATPPVIEAARPVTPLASVQSMQNDLTLKNGPSRKINDTGGLA